MTISCRLTFNNARFISFTCGKKYSTNQTFMKTRYKKWANDYALENFDEFYKPVYKSLWPSIRLALLSQHKYCCFINNFADIEESMQLMQKINAIDIREKFDKRLQFLQDKLANEDQLNSELRKSDLEINLEAELEMEEDIRSADCPATDSVERFASHDSDKSSYFNQYIPASKLTGLDNWVDESDYFQTCIKSGENFKINTIKSAPRPLPDNWNVFCFKRSDCSTYPSPRNGLTGVLNYYLMDATSLLPVFALDPSPGDTILDMCSAPGGKALAVLQTLHKVKLVCVDDQLDRAKRLRRVFNAYIPKGTIVDEPTIVVGDGRNYANQKIQFNKIIVDAPCTTDRRSVIEKENNIFKPSRIRERVQIPSVQTELLSAALEAVMVGGSVVYSTCSLSPVQNDNVVQLALKSLSEKSSATFVIDDISHLLFPFRFLMRFHSSPKYGQLVIPFIPCNFGPMYICKISKTSE